MSKKILIKNSIFGFVQFILTATITLISVPIFIQNLGMEVYGIFALVSVIGNLNFLANFGLNRALLVYLAKQGKCRESDHDIIVTLIIIIAFTVIFSLLVLLFQEYIIQNLFSIPSQYFQDSKQLLVLLTLSNSILLVGQTYSAIIDANQKIYISKIYQLIYSVIYWGGLNVAVIFGGQLKIIGLIALGSSIIWFLLVRSSSRRIWGKLDFTLLQKNFKSTAKKQISYGSKIYMAGMTGIMFEPFSKILLSNFIGLPAVALYDIGIKVKDQLNGIFSTVFYPLLPFAANSIDNLELKKKIFDVSKKIQLIVLPISIILGFILTVLTKLWLGGSNYEQPSIFIIILTISTLLFSQPILPIYVYLEAKGMADRNIWLQFSNVFFNTIFFLAFYKELGIYTILLSNSIGIFSSYILGNFFQQKYLEINYKNESSYYLKLIIFGLLCLFFCSVVRYFIGVSLWDLLIFPILVGTISIFFVRRQKLLTNDDIETYFGYFPYLKTKLSGLLIKK